MKKGIVLTAMAGVALMGGTAMANEYKVYDSQGGITDWIDGENAEMRVEIFIEDHGEIKMWDMVGLNDFSHTWAGDLTIALEHKDTGTTVVLVNRPGMGDDVDGDGIGDGFDAWPGEGCCGDSSDFGGNYVFRDGGDNLNQALAAIGGAEILDDSVAYAPQGTPTMGQGSLDAFVGEDKFGLWSLRVYDGAAGDVGSLGNFTIGFFNVPAPGALALLGLAGLVGRRRRA
jgi:subtilisin-like proprotein convertase family protein